jgi:hypothetical protein
MEEGALSETGEDLAALEKDCDEVESRLRRGKGTAHPLAEVKGRLTLSPRERGGSPSESPIVRAVDDEALCLISC